MSARLLTNRGPRLRPQLQTTNTEEPFQGLRPGTSLPQMVTPNLTTRQPDEEEDSIVTTYTTTSRASIRRNLHRSSNSRSSSTSSTLPGFVINEFPSENFEDYILWFSETFGNQKMFLSLDYSTLEVWLREYLHVSSFQEVHQLALIPPRVLLSTFGYTLVEQYQNDLVELKVIIQFINYQVSSGKQFPWSLESYFAYRMNQYTRTKVDYTPPTMDPPNSPPKYTRVSPWIIPEPPSKPSKSPHSYHSSPP